MSEQDQIISAIFEHLKKYLSLLSYPNDTSQQNEDEFTKKLTEHRYKLIHTMCQTSKVMDYLESSSIIPRPVCSRILHEYRVPEDRNRALIDFLYNRAKLAFRPLIEALYLAGNEHLVLLLDETFLLSDVRRQLDNDYRFPTVLAQQSNVPTSLTDEKIRNMNQTIDLAENTISNIDFIDPELNKYEEEVQMGFQVQLLTLDVLEKYPELDPKRRSLKSYRMLSNPRGQCLIINNIDAFKTMPVRQGSDIDASKLKSLFEQMGFHIVYRRNLTSKDMMNVLQDFAQSIEEKKDTSDCAVVVILSHGGNGTIYSVDELELNVDRHIIPIFDDHLIGKPKLFIFQACRGSQCNIRPDSMRSNSSWLSDSVTNENEQRNLIRDNQTVSKVPIRSDMVIWYSTLKDYVSWRMGDEGSIFIQTLITIFAKTAWCYDLVTMVQCVNRTIQEKFATHESIPFQTPCCEYHLHYPLFFNPGCSDQ